MLTGRRALSLGDELRHRAIPTFTNILHTLAPPISSHERLLIHITHDMVGYPSLDPLVHGVFSRVMAQVEGGDLLVVQRGQESSGRRHSSDTAAAGWRDGPWWRQADAPRDLGLVKGLTEGTKLCRASADAYSTEYFAAHGGVEQARVRATEPLSESNPVRSSDLFLSVQAVTVDADRSLFAGGSAAERGEGGQRRRRAGRRAGLLRRLHPRLGPRDRVRQRQPGHPRQVGALARRPLAADARQRRRGCCRRRRRRRRVVGRGRRA